MIDITIEDYKKLLAEHDWAYQYTDNFTEWQREEGKRQTIRRIAMINQGEYQELYEQKVNKNGSQNNNNR